MWRVGKIEKWSHACARERGGTGDAKDNVLFLPRAVGRMVYNNLELMQMQTQPWHLHQAGGNTPGSGQ